jgi:hypothetical protein
MVQHVSQRKEEANRGKQTGETREKEQKLRSGRKKTDKRIS